MVVHPLATGPDDPHPSPPKSAGVLMDSAVRAVISLAIVGVFCYLSLMTTDYKDALIAAASGVLGYWIGSSSGSREKNVLLTKE